MAKKLAVWIEPQGRTIDPVLVNALIAEIGNTFFSVGFYNKDGELREIKRARLNVTSRMADNGKAGTNAASDSARATLAAHSLIPVVDLDTADNLETRDMGWRSFKADRVAYIKGAGKAM